MAMIKISASFPLEMDAPASGFCPKPASIHFIHGWHYLIYSMSFYYWPPFCRRCPSLFQFSSLIKVSSVNHPLRWLHPLIHLFISKQLLRLYLRVVTKIFSWMTSNLLSLTPLKLNS